MAPNSKSRRGGNAADRADDEERLLTAVAQLTEEARILRQSLDELRDDVVWAARQVLAAGEATAPGYLADRQRDPFVPNAELERQRAVANRPETEPPASGPTKQQTLFG
jgi:hypothetical protein